jgi:predicted nucleic acid-binding protein
VSEKLVLDSFALVSLFHREPGWQVVQKALYDQDRSRNRAILNWINWGEFYYIVKRRVGAAPRIRSVSLNNCPLNSFR